MYKLILVFALQLIIFTSGCKKPTCDVALEKAETCLKKENEKPDKNHTPIFLQICKKNKSKFDKCNKIKECTAFRSCISEAATNQEAVKEYNKLYNIKETDDNTEKEPKEKTDDNTKDEPEEKTDDNTKDEPEENKDSQ